MNHRYGYVALLLAGCTVQPIAELRPVETQLARHHSEIPTMAPTLRIGVEYLPPERNAATSPEVEATITARPERSSRAATTLVERSRVPEARHTWALGAEDLAAIDNPVARATLQFVDDLVREDKRRTEREVRLPFLDWEPAELDVGQRLWSEVEIAEAQGEWVGENGTSLLSRPMRQVIRRFPLVSELELTLDEFRSSFVPMSEPYRQSHAAERKLGRLSVRLHASDLDDPVEIVYMRSGLRVGSSRERGKLAIDWPLTENVSLTLRSRRNWITEESRLRADLAYRHSATTSVRLAAGDDMDFLSTSSIYSLFEAPMDGSPGFLLYAVHIF